MLVTIVTPAPLHPTWKIISALPATTVRRVPCCRSHALMGIIRLRVLVKRKIARFANLDTTASDKLTSTLWFHAPLVATVSRVKSTLESVLRELITDIWECMKKMPVKIVWEAQTATAPVSPIITISYVHQVTGAPREPVILAHAQLVLLDQTRVPMKKVQLNIGRHLHQLLNVSFVLKDSIVIRLLQPYQNSAPLVPIVLHKVLNSCLAQPASTAHQDQLNLLSVLQVTTVL